jgi:hypothetical protein
VRPVLLIRANKKWFKHQNKIYGDVHDYIEILEPYMIPKRDANRGMTLKIPFTLPKHLQSKKQQLLEGGYQRKSTIK